MKKYFGTVFRRVDAETTGIAQSDISKIENGSGNPTIKLLKRLADGLGMNLKIEFTPKTSFAIR